MSCGSSAEGVTSTAAFFGYDARIAAIFDADGNDFPVAALLSPKQGHHLVPAVSLFSAKGGGKVLVFRRFAGIVVRRGNTFLIRRHVRRHAHQPEFRGIRVLGRFQCLRPFVGRLEHVGNGIRRCRCFR